MNYTYNGGNDVVYSAGYSNDTYNVTISRENSERINECEGLSDAINIITEDPDDLRVFVRNDDHSWDTKNIIIVNKEDFTVENLINFVEGNNQVGLEISTPVSGIENFKINGTAINQDTWYSHIHFSVLLWLDENAPSSSITDAIATYKQAPSSIDISGLISVYTNIKYSDGYAA